MCIYHQTGPQESERKETAEWQNEKGTWDVSLHSERQNSECREVQLQSAKSPTSTSEHSNRKAVKGPLHYFTDTWSLFIYFFVQNYVCSDFGSRYFAFESKQIWIWYVMWKGHCTHMCIICHELSNTHDIIRHREITQVLWFLLYIIHIIYVIYYFSKGSLEPSTCTVRSHNNNNRHSIIVNFKL
jgi:hypothetical protein